MTDTNHTPPWDEPDATGGALIEGESTRELTNTQAFNALPKAMQEKLAKRALAMQENATINTNKIGVKNPGGGAYVMPDGTKVDSFTGIILAAKHANKHYAGAYNPNDIQPPDCAAVMKDGDGKNEELTPLDGCSHKYADTCAQCTYLEWGSALTGTGKGKECVEHVLLAVYIPSLKDIFLLEERKARAAQVDKYLVNVTGSYGHSLMVYTTFSIGFNQNDLWQQSFEINHDMAMTQETTLKAYELLDTAEKMLYSSVEASLSGGSNEQQKPATEATKARRGARK